MQKIDKIAEAKNEFLAMNTAFDVRHLEFVVRDYNAEVLRGDILMRYIGAPTLPGF